MKNKTLLLAFVAVALVAAMGIAPAWAYFTDSDTVAGAIPVKVKPKTDIYESYKEGVKHVVVTNDADSSMPVYVRARVYASNVFTLTISGESWTGPTEEWYYYDGIVDPGGETTQLDIKVEFPPYKSATQPTGAEFGDNYNVVVMYESTPVQYDAEGNPYADWEYILDEVVESEG